MLIARINVNIKSFTGHFFIRLENLITLIIKINRTKIVTIIRSYTAILDLSENFFPAGESKSRTIYFWQADFE